MNRPEHFSGIDLVRFLSAMLVVSFHFLYLNASAAAINPASFGWIGVEVFFVISGVVIANSARKSTALEFLKGRARRLYPAAWICTTIALVLAIADGDSAMLPERYVRSMILFPNGPWVDSVYWTLGVEMGFYTLVFVLLTVRQFARINVLAAAMTGISMTLVLFRAATAFGLLSPSALSQLTIRHEQALDVILMARHGAFFAFGIFIWLSSQRRLFGWERLCIAAATIACIGEIVLRSVDFLPHAYSMKAAIAPVAIWTVSIGFLLADTQRWTPRLALPLLGTLGLMTYPLYLVHNSLGTFVIHKMVAERWPWLIAVLFAVAIALAVSLAVVHMERSIRALSMPPFLRTLYDRKVLFDPFRWHSWTIYFLSSTEAESSPDERDHLRTNVASKNE